MATFVLVHGAFHGSWCWEKLVKRLAAAGHVVHAPDLAGMGDDRTPNANVTMLSWKTAIADIVRRHRGVILLGHSMGGFVISAAAELCADHLAALVYLSAVLPGPGQTIIEWSQALAGEQEALRDAPNYVTDDGLAVGLGKDAYLRGLFYNRCDDADIAFARERLGVTPVPPMMEAIELSDAGYGRVPRIYIETTEDLGLPIVVQRRAQAFQPCRKVYSMAADHSPFFSDVDGLAAILCEIANDYSR